MIVSWQGSIETIPDGWALCDGTEGRPDLRNLFVVAAGDTYAPGDKRPGIELHRHDFTSDSHAHQITSGNDIDLGLGRHFGTLSKSSTGTTNNEWSPPPYYSLAFIVKVD